MSEPRDLGCYHLGYVIRKHYFRFGEAVVTKTRNEKWKTIYEQCGCQKKHGVQGVRRRRNAHGGAQGCELRGAHGRTAHAGRPVRLRQDDAAQRHRRNAGCGPR